ncbi:MAG: ATP-binding cassette, subfamily bacterial [Frankiales bacterium]|jgi:ABC-type multidrug transport system fused ATPase/permease subunit|nr:ATP-binding cassette, subfamily bacterial [Frankiales bacterium]
MTTTTVHVSADGDLLVDNERRLAGRRLLLRMVGEHRGRTIIAMTAVVLSTAAVVSIPFLVGYGLNDIVRHRRLGPMLWSLAGVIVAALVDYAMQSVAQRLVGVVAETSVRDLRVRLFGHVLSQPLAFFERMRSGRVISRMTSDIDAIYELFGQASITVVSNILTVVGILGVMFYLDWALGLTVLAVVPIIVIATVAFARSSGAAYQRVRERVAVVISSMTESLTGVRVVQAFAREPLVAGEFRRVNRDYRDANAETVRLMSLFAPGLELIGQLAVVLVLIVGGYRALGSPDPAAYVGVITAFVLYLRLIFDPLQELSQYYNSWQAAKAGATQIAGVLDTSSTLPEPTSPVALPDGPGEVRFEAVSFGYTGAPVLHGVDLVLPGGSTLALVGATGAGKSTIAKLASRLYDPTDGRVTLDGVDVRDIASAQLRGAIAVVPQEPYLFDGTIADNIRLGRASATDEDVAAAAAAVGLDGVIEALPDGYETDLRGRGARLSGGHRQLISFARALIANPRLLVLDEATSSLDLPSERLVQRALATLLSGRTAIVIAHRFSSLEIADQVAVVESGRLVEAGPRAALLETDSRFRRMHEEWLRTHRTYPGAPNEPGT